MKRGERDMDDSELQVLVHDAYEAVVPEQGASDRVLAALLEAQNDVRPSPRRVRVWWIALPVAACLALAVALVQVRTASGPAMSADAVVQEKSGAKSEAVDEAAEANAQNVASSDAAVSTEVAPMSSGEAADAGVVDNETSDTEAPIRVVTLNDGSSYVVGDALDEEPTQDTVEEVVLDGRTCVVANHEALRFEGEDVWYELKPVGRH